MSGVTVKGHITAAVIGRSLNQSLVTIGKYNTPLIDRHDRLPALALIFMPCQLTPGRAFAEGVALLAAHGRMRLPLGGCERGAVEFAAGGCEVVAAVAVVARYLPTTAFAKLLSMLLL